MAVDTGPESHPVQMRRWELNESHSEKQSTQNEINRISEHVTILRKDIDFPDSLKMKQ